MAFNEFNDDPSKLMLGAINTLLNTIGEEDIDNEEDVEAILEAKQARKDLIQVKREVLSSGWDINEDKGYTLPLGINGQIPIPANVLQVASNDSDLIIRNHFLYSKSAQTNVFTEAQTVDILWDLEFNSLPEALRNYITLKAARRFRDRTLGADATHHGFTAVDENDAYMEARRSEATTSNANMLSFYYDINRA